MWRLRFADREWSSADVTIAHVMAVGVLLGRHEWVALDAPRSPEFVHAWLVALLAGEVGLTEALETVNAAPMQVLFDAVVMADEE